jgi:hypothetical protein
LLIDCLLHKAYDIIVDVMYQEVVMKGFWLLVLLIFASAAVYAVDPPKPVVVEGTCVELITPEGYSKVDSVAGYISTDLKASLHVTIIDAAFKVVAPAYTKEGLAQHGVDFVKSQKMSFGVQNGLLVTSTKVKDDVKYLQSVGVFGNDLITAAVTGTIPSDSPQKSIDVLLTAVKSARMNETLFKDPCAGLPFYIREIEPFGVANKSKDAIVLTPEGKAKVDIANEATFAVGVLPRKAGATDVTAYAKARVLGASYATDIEIAQTKNLILDRLPAVVVVAMANHKETGTPIAIFMAVIAEKDVFYVFQGVTAQTEEGQKFFTVFQQMTGSFRKRTG